jgi:hypothetical protein
VDRLVRAADSVSVCSSFTFSFIGQDSLENFSRVNLFQSDKIKMFLFFDYLNIFKIVIASLLDRFRSKLERFCQDN